MSNIKILFNYSNEELVHSFGLGSTYDVLNRVTYPRASSSDVFLSSKSCSFAKTFGDERWRGFAIRALKQSDTHRSAPNPLKGTVTAC